MSNRNRFHLPGRYLSVLIVCAGLILLFILSGCSGPVPPPTLDNNAIATAAFQTALAIQLQTQIASSPTPEPTSTPAPTATNTEPPPLISTEALIPITGADCIPNNPAQTGLVVDIVDGDTIKVLLDEDGQTYSVRYIGMDTPENTSQIEYFGAEATSKNTELVYDKHVTLIKDVSEADQYGRLLRYVLTEDTFVNYELVIHGYANTASFPPDIACIPTFQTAEEQAFALKLGLWGAPPPTPTHVILLPLPTATSGGSSGGSGGNAPCNCGGPDLDCGDFGTHASAQTCFNYCRSAGFGDVFRLDGDDDGSACESLP